MHCNKSQYGTLGVVQLSRSSDLALRALMRLAVADEREERMTAAVIAESVEASVSHVAKIVSRLVELGLAESRRGRGGGLVITELGRHESVGRLLRRGVADGRSAASKATICDVSASGGTGAGRQPKAMSEPRPSLGLCPVQPIVAMRSRRGSRRPWTGSC